MSFLMEPSWGVLETLRTLEKEAAAFSPQGADSDFINYMPRGTLTGDNLLRIKLNLNSAGGWKFACEDPNFQPDNAFMRPGDPVKVTLGAGIYYNAEDLRYGIYYTLKHLDQSGSWLAPAPAPKQYQRILKRGEVLVAN